MGIPLAKLNKSSKTFSKKSKARILMLGLDNAGKTTILYKVKWKVDSSTMPTIGYNVETLSPCKGVTFTLWDVGGQKKIRHLWRNYHDENTVGVLYVVDSADTGRLEEAREELFGFLKADDLRAVPVVIIANKQDSSGSLRPAELIDAMGLLQLVDRKWHVQAACARTGEGLRESLSEMVRLVKESHLTNGHKRKKPKDRPTGTPTYVADILSLIFKSKIDF